MKSANSHVLQNIIDLGGKRGLCVCIQRTNKYFEWAFRCKTSPPPKNIGTFEGAYLILLKWVVWWRCKLDLVKMVCLIKMLTWSVNMGCLKHFTETVLVSFTTPPLPPPFWTKGKTRKIALFFWIFPLSICLSVCSSGNLHWQTRIHRHEYTLTETHTHSPRTQRKTYTYTHTHTFFTQLAHPIPDILARKRLEPQPHTPPPPPPPPLLPPPPPPDLCSPLTLRDTLPVTHVKFFRWSSPVAQSSCTSAKRGFESVPSTLIVSAWKGVGVLIPGWTVWGQQRIPVCRSWQARDTASVETWSASGVTQDEGGVVHYHCHGVKTEA